MDGLDDSGSITCNVIRRFFSLPSSFQKFWVPPQFLSNGWVQKPLFPGVMWPEREYDYSPASNARG
jgi:hypothetical protein